MAGQPIPLKQAKILVVDLEKQGCKIKLVKNGWMILFPDGSSYTLHTSSSDHRAGKEVRAAVRRAGLRWPDKLPA